MLQLLGNRYLIGVVAGVVLVVGVWLHGQRTGRTACQQAATDAANEIAQAYADQADELRSRAEQRKTIVREKVRTIYVEKDPTGCADTAAPEWMLDSLRPSAD